MATVANTVTDKRGDTLSRHPVWKAVVGQMSWASGETNEDTSTVNVNGVVTSIVATYSAADANITLAIKDLAGNTRYTTTDADGATYVFAADGTEYGLNQLAGDGFIVSVTSTDPGAGGVTADITVYGV